MNAIELVKEYRNQPETTDFNLSKLVEQLFFRNGNPRLENLVRSAAMIMNEIDRQLLPLKPK